MSVDVPGEGTPRVMVVDDEPDLAEMYAEYLSEVAETTSVEDGETALERLDEDVDGIFLDRDMPGLTGDQVLAQIRETEYDPYVAMLTGVEPDLSVFDMEFDEYLVKPVSKEQLQETVAELLQRSAFGEEMQELFAKTTKRNLVREADPGDAWSKEEVSAIVEDADVAPAPGVFGGWNSGKTKIREEDEREFAESVDRHTLPVLLERAADERGDRPAQFFRLDRRPRSVADLFESPRGERRTITHDHFREIVRGLAVGFASLGVDPGSRVLLSSGPRVEAAWTDLAVLSAGGVVVGTDRSTDPESLGRRVDRLDPVGAIVESPETAQRWDRAFADSSVEFVVAFDELDQPATYRSPVVELGGIYRRSRDVDEEVFAGLLNRLSPDSPAALVSRGDVAPLELTHRNLLENATQVYARLTARRDGPVDLEPGDELLTALDPTDPYGRVLNHYLGIAFGTTTSYPADVDDIQEVARRDAPAVVAAPTDVAERFAQRVVAEAYAETTIATMWSIDWGTRVAKDHRYERQPGGIDRLLTLLADRVGVREIRQQAGFPEALVYGPDPVEETTHEHLYGAGIPPVCAWAPGRAGVFVSATPPDDPRGGSLGIPLYDEDVDVKWTPAAEEVETDGEVGELAVAGPNLPSSVATDDGSAPFDEEGRLKTGVVVEWDPEDVLWRRS